MSPADPANDGPTAQLLLIRHGRTDWNATGRFLGRTDRPLDDEGRAQASALRGWASQVDVVVSSPLARAWQTAEALGGASERIDALAELDHGELEGLVADEALARFPRFFEAWQVDPASVPVPGGGVLGEARDQAMEALRGLAVRHPGRRVAVVSHQLVLASVLATLDGQPLSAWRSYKLPNAGCAVVRAWSEVPRMEVVASSVAAGGPLPPVV
jgi:broad specificity phosphatase PhoE